MANPRPKAAVALLALVAIVVMLFSRRDAPGTEPTVGVPRAPAERAQPRAALMLATEREPAARSAPDVAIEERTEETIGEAAKPTPRIEIRIVDAAGQILSRPPMPDNPFVRGVRPALYVVATSERPTLRSSGFRAPCEARYGLGTWEAGSAMCVDGPGTCSGALVLHDEPPYWISVALGSMVLESRYLAELESPLTFRVHLDPAIHFGGFEFRVLDAATLEPLNTAQCREHYGYAVSHTSAQDWNVVLTPLDDEGRGMVSGLAPGIWSLGFRIPGFESRWIRVEVVAGERRDLGDIALERSTFSFGKVVTADGVGVPATVWCRSPQPPFETRGLQPGMDEDGAFAIAEAPAGEVLVGFQAEGLAGTPQVFTIPPGGLEEGLRLLAEPGSSVKLTLISEPPQEVVLTVLNGVGDCAWQTTRWVDGEELDLCLLDGRYVVDVQSTGGERWRFPLDVAGPTECALELSR